MSNELINQEGSKLFMELFNQSPKKILMAMPGTFCRRTEKFMVANGYRMVFGRWHLQEKSATQHGGKG